MVTPAPKSVLITGASAGIGRATALHLGRRGYRVVATGRSLSRLADLEKEAQEASSTLWPFELDVNDADSVTQQMPSILQQVGTLDVLVNNAGYGLRGFWEDLDLDEVRDQFETNLFAVLRMVQAVLPHMRERGEGTIINVGSVAGLIGSPGSGAYAASKAALWSLSAVLRMELRPFGIRVALIEPGAIHTDFQKNQVIAGRAQAHGSLYRSFDETVQRSSARYHGRAGEPLKVAKTVEKIIRARNPRPRYSVGVDAALGAMAARLLPDRVLEFLVRRALSR